MLPIEPGVSWETHLSAAVIGVLLALALRKLDIPPRKRYEWEDQTAEEDSEALSVADGDDGAAPR